MYQGLHQFHVIAFWSIKCQVIGLQSYKMFDAPVAKNVGALGEQQKHTHREANGNSRQNTLPVLSGIRTY